VFASLPLLERREKVYELRFQKLLITHACAERGSRAGFDISAERAAVLTAKKAALCTFVNKIKFRLRGMKRLDTKYNHLVFLFKFLSICQAD